jgi:hypothetical protein
MKKDFKQVGRRKVFITNFNSISELVVYCKTAPINTNVFKGLQSVKGDYHFTQTSNYDEAVNLLLNGWENGASKLTKELRIANKNTKEIQKTVNDIVGFIPNVPLYLQGVPQNMVNKKSVKVKQKVITLLKGINYHGGIKAEQILKDSVKFIQIVQAIEAKGIRVNVEVVSWVTDNEYALDPLKASGEEIFMRVPIKKASERLNLSKMSFPLLHPSFLRRIIFRARETELRVTNSYFGRGYGYSVMAGKFVPSLINKNEYYIPALISDEEARKIIEEAK